MSKLDVRGMTFVQLFEALRGNQDHTQRKQLLTEIKSRPEYLDERGQPRIVLPAR